LSALQKAGRLTYVQLAEHVGLSESACLRRVRLLEQNGVIDKYVMLIDQMAIGKPRNNEDYMRIHNRLTGIPGVLRVQSSFALKTVQKKTELPLG